MSAYAPPIVATLLLWWASTGLILYLDGLSRRSFPWSMTGATAGFLLALWGMVATGGTTSAASAYCAFCCGLMAWGWQLVSYYMGFITGPSRAPCPPDLRGWPRFVAAVRTSLYHELAIVICAVGLVALTWDQPNQIGVWTFLILWWMHTSAKLNLFFGAPNLSEELLPEHLRYLVTYMRRRPMNLFFPVSVTASTIVAVLIGQRALATTIPFELVGYTILATLMALAVAEHWFLVAPLHANALWSWGVKNVDASGAASGRENIDPLRAVMDVTRVAGRI
jgi:putative photosynthetic complex assembly protein 2